MRARFKVGFAGYLLMPLLGLALLTLAIGAPMVHAASVGQLAYDFHGTTVGDRQVSLASYAGKPLILIFWNSW